MCLAVLCLDSVKKETCTCVNSKITPTLLLSETIKGENGFMNTARKEKHSDCPSFWKCESHQTPAIMLETSSTRCVNSQDQATVFFVLDTRLDMREAVHHNQEANALQLVSLWKTWNCLSLSSRVMIHPFWCMSGLHQRASIVLGDCDGYDRVEAVSEGGLACTNSLPFPLPFLRESTCILLSSSAPVPFPADAGEDAPKLGEE